MCFLTKNPNLKKKKKFLGGMGVGGVSGWGGGGGARVSEFFHYESKLKKKFFWRLG